MPPVDLDSWLPEPHIRIEHRRAAPVPPRALWDAAEGVRLDETRTLGHLVRWRIPGTPAGITFQALFARHPFCVLAEGEHWSVSGLAGRIWSLRRGYAALDGADAFRAWDAAGTARVLFAHWVEAGGDGHAALCSEARVQATDARAALRLRALWAMVRPFEALIGSEPLALAARRATERVSEAGGPGT